MASSFWDIWTVVSGGLVNSAKRVSSNPITERLSGTLIFCSYACRMTPIAVISLLLQ